MPLAKRSASTSLLVERGLAPSRERARALILAGQVTRRRRRSSTKAGTPVAADARRRARRARSSRTSAAAASSSRTRSTSSASTRRDGGRSTSARRPAASPTCCCSAARASVVALDVGHGQLDWRLRNDPRVIVLEGVNARALTPRRGAGPGRPRDDRRLVHLAAATSCPRCRRSRRPAPTSSRWSSRSSRPGRERGRQARHRPRPGGARGVIARVTGAGRGGRTDARGDDAVADHRRHRQPGVLPAPADAGRALECATIGRSGTRLMPHDPSSRPPVSRVGIVAKSHLRAAAPHLADIAAWLAARGSRRCSRRRPRR